MDLNHCLAFSPSKMKIYVGDYSMCKDADLIMIAAGVNQKPGESRRDLLQRNASIFKSIIDSCMNSGFNGIFLIATNPVDVMTYITQKFSGLPYNKVFGTGTSLDTARLRYLVGDKLNIDPTNVHGYVIGEHGDSEFVPWSNVNVGLQKITDFLSEEDMLSIAEDVKNAAYEIINKKGATYYGIGMTLVKLTNAILGNEHAIAVVSNYDSTNDVYVGLPAVLDGTGIAKKIYFDLNKDEEERLQYSINVIRESINEIEL